MPDTSFKSLVKSLRKLAGTLGQLRELDVTIRDGSKYSLDVQEVKKERHRMRRKVRRITNEKRRHKVTGLLKSFVQTTNRQQILEIAQATNNLRRKLLPWISDLPTKEIDLHRLRVLTKKTRYILEAIGQPHAPLTHLQNELGRWHDYQVMCQSLKAPNKLEALFARSSQPLIRPTLEFAVRNL